MYLRFNIYGDENGKNKILELNKEIKVIVKLFFIVGITAGSLGLLNSFSNLIVLNGLGNTFYMIEDQSANIEII